MITLLAWISLGAAGCVVVLLIAAVWASGVDSNKETTGEGWMDADLTEPWEYQEK